MDKKKVAVYGTKSRATDVIDGLNGSEFEVTYFIHNDASKIYDENNNGMVSDEITNYEEKVMGLDVISINEISKYLDRIDIIAIPKLNNIERWTIFQIRKQHFPISKIYMVDNSKMAADNISEWFVPYFDFGYIPYLEFHIEDKCNLNCKACEHYAPLVKKSLQPDKKQFERDLLQLKKYIFDIDKIRILGGEPLLNKDIEFYVRVSREVYPESEIRIATNGLLVKQMPDSLFETMKNYNVGFDISSYPPIADKLDTIIDFIESKGVDVGASPIVNNFYMRYSLEYNNQPEKEFELCFQSMCHNLYYGKIASCFLPFMQHYFNDAFGENMPEEGYVDLYEDGLTTRKLKERLYAPLKRCGYCGRAKKIDWKQAEKEPVLSDWVVDSNSCCGGIKG